MIFPICVLAAGLVLGLLGILLRKKLGRVWMSSFLAAAVLLLACGGWFLRGHLVQVQERKESVYLSLRYLERYDSGSAAFYLKNAGAAEDYVTAAARALLEQVRGNDLTARLNLDIAQAEARGTEETDFLQILRVLQPEQQDQLSLAVGRLVDFLGISPARQTALDFYVQAGDGSGWVDSSSLPAGVDETTYQRLQISSLIRSGSYEQAVAAAVALTDRDGSADNRLLLAGTVAESAYSGVVLSSGAFARSDGGTAQEDLSVQRERAALEEQRQALLYELAEIELLSENAADDAAFLELSQEKLALNEEIQRLQTRGDKLYVYRAFSAIADLRSLEADLVRARLYFALQDYEAAVDTVLHAADSLTARLSSDHTLVNALQVVKSAYDSSEPFYDSQEFRDSMTQLLAAPFSDLVYLSQSALTADFVERIVSDQKTYGRALFISGLDLTDYPTVRVVVSGREELLQRLVERETVTVRDTRSDVSYTAEVQESVLSNVAIVVDRSGSMDGSPMANLKAALQDFAGNMSEDTAAALVAFDSSAELLSALNRDPSALQAMADTLDANGNTDITAGIRAGVEALSSAAGGRVMLLMTDGQSGIDFTAVDDAAAAGIVIHTIGFGDVNDALLQQIADTTGGQYVRAESSSELSNVYASLQQVIGNTVTLTYTVSNEEVLTQRYVFLQVDAASARMSYSLAADESLPRLDACSPAVLSTENLARWAESGNQVTLTLTGERLEDISAVTVGGQEAVLQRQDEDQLRITLSPQLAPGWQTVTLRDADGEEISFDRLVLVGEPRTYRNLRLGSLEISYGQGVLPGDGTLVLTGGSMELRENASGASTLSLYVNGTLTLPWTAPADWEETASAVSDLGDSGTITGWGVVTLGRNDGAYTSGAPNLVARGALTLVCSPEQTQLICEEGAVQ